MTTRTEAPLGYVPHFEVNALDGRRVRYGDIWQRRNLVLVAVARAQRDAGARYASALQERRQAFEEAETTVVVTDDAIPMLPASTILVADRWGEILHRETASAGQASPFPPVDELLSWVQFAQIQCPECPP